MAIIFKTDETRRRNDMKAKTVRPAYGRAYKNQREIEADISLNRDFIIADFFDRYDGKPVSPQDLASCGYTHIKVRYADDKKVHIVAL